MARKPVAELPQIGTPPRQTFDTSYISKAHSFDRLPFVYCPKVGAGREFWAPRPSGNYIFDCTLGQIYGEATLPLLREPGGHQLLRNIVCAILKQGDPDRDRGVIVGMFGEIGKALEQP